MITSFISFIQETVLPLGAGGVFVASLLEEIIAPIPSALVQLASGFLFLQGGIDSVWIFNFIFVILIPVSLGVAFGSLLVYGIAYSLGKPALVKWGKWFGLEWREVEELQEKFEHTKADEITLFTLRALPVVPSVVVSALYGLIRFDVKKYIFLSFCGTLIRAGVLAVVGWYVGAVYVETAHLVDQFENYILIAMAVGVVAFIIYKKRVIK